MIGPGLAGASFDAYATGYASGLAGQITVTIEDADGNVELAPTTANIIEIDAGGTFSTYRYTGTYPATLGDYVLIWEDPDGIQAAEDMTVASQVTASTPDAPTLGPCESWISADDVAACCTEEQGSDTSVYDDVAVQASMLLFELSGRQFTGLCTRTVRPTIPGCTCWVRADGYTWAGTCWTNGPARCGCGHLSKVKLAGYPVREILEVTIDGTVISPDEYRLDQWRYLVRLADTDGNRQSWPACQRLDRAATEESTFAVTYLHGVAPPPLGISAAAQLACELYKACTPSAGDCELPSGITRVVRQGITTERVAPLANLFRQGATGLALVDAFIAGYNPGKSRRRPAVWSPDVQRFAQREGI